jgi:hypothetical protein
MSRGLYVPRHYLPHTGMTDEELLSIAGLTSFDHLQHVEQAGMLYDPSILAHEMRQPPVPVISDLTRELPLDPVDQRDLDSRLPEPDFVPESVTDPRQRARMRKQIRAREGEQIQRWRREGQYGGVVDNLSPGQSASVLQWYAETDEPRAVNIQLSWTIGSPNPTYTFTNPAGPQFPNVTPPAPFVGQASDTVSLYAKVEWGGGAAQHLAFCDFQSGTQLRLTGSFVRITALYQPTNLPTGWPSQPDQLTQSTPPTGPNLQVSAILGMGFPSFRTSAARFTRKLLVAANSTLQSDTIPAFASAFGFAASLAAPNIGFKLTQNQSGETNSMNFVSTANPTADNTFPLPQGYRFIDVKNNQGSAVGVSLVYALML